MKILFCNKYNFAFSGTEVYLFELMDLLRSHGHEVALFSMQDPRGESSPYNEYCVPHIDFKDPQAGFITRARLAAHAIYSTDARRRLRGLISAFHPDIAHIRNIYHHLSPSILWELKAQGIPMLYHLNDFKLLCPTYNLVANGRVCQRPCTGRYWKVLTNSCYSGGLGESVVLGAEAYAHYWARTYQKCVDHFLVPSQFAKQMLVQNGLNAPKITVLPHFQGVPESVSPAAREAPILYFGRLSPEKGVADLVRAMEFVPDVLLKIAGEGPQRSALELLTLSLNARNVEFLGQMGPEELGKLIASSRFTVLPSRAYETLGKSILESFAQARTVIASDLGSRRELVHDYVTGLLFQTGNIEQLAGAISYLTERPELAVQMGLAGRQFVQSYHSPQKHYEELVGLYERLVVEGHSRQGPASKSKPVRVAFIGGRGLMSKYSGIETYYEEVGRRLAEMGFEVTVYSRTFFTPRVQEYKGMRVVRLPTVRSKHLETLIHTFLSTIHVMFTDCDIVHYHALGPALFSALPRLVGKKSVVTVQGLDWQRKKWGRLASVTLKLGEVASARLPGMTIVVSKELQNHYRMRHGVNANYIPNGAVMRNRSDVATILQWGLKPDDYILFLGRFSPEKNCDLLIAAYEKAGISLKLVLAGGSSHTDSYETQLRRCASDNIMLLDWVSGAQLTELLTNAALFVLPSDLEGLSLALLDAMGAGVCVLASDIPENREVVEDAGFTFRTGDVDDLARMLGLLASDPEVRAAAGRAGQRIVEERYLWSRVAQEMCRCYEKLSGRSIAVKDQPGSEQAEKLHHVP
ncbi:MAG TPA: glycosyltransferase family 4 protein [Terriglobales bacterium]|nr:glycosyltransferase family 4 protein [Terriglobales bacterium]